MRLFKPINLLSVIVLQVSLLRCAEADVAHETRREPLTDLVGCRSFASAGSARWGQTPGDLACSFDVVRQRRACQISAGAVTLTTTEDYASTADFIEAGRHVGKRTSLRETHTERGAMWLTTHHYDELGRLSRSHEERAGGSIALVYSDYDDSGRPRRAIAQKDVPGDTGCNTEIVSIEYSDSERTASFRFKPADAARCGFAVRSLIEHYDARGNRVSVDEADGTGVATLFEAGRGTKTEQVCL
jgi:hypothetical protein